MNEKSSITGSKSLFSITYMDLPMDWNDVNDIGNDKNDDKKYNEEKLSLSDALVLSLSNRGKVDFDYISERTGADYKTIIETLRGAIYQNPDTWEEDITVGWETAEEYLSGNLYRKLQSAYAANEEYKGYFSANIDALEKVLPPVIKAEDIYVTIGSPWIPTDIIDDFILDTFGNWIIGIDRFTYDILYRSSYETRHDEITGTWEIPYKSRYFMYNAKVEQEYGTIRINALQIIERTLNMKTVCVLDEVPCDTNKSGVKKVINKEETVLALEKQKKLIEEFQRWVWSDLDRKERIVNIFQEKYGYLRRRIYDGSFLDFPTMSSDIHMYPHQKDAVARILFTPNTLLAHDVGAGKTYVMIAAGMETRRMGLSKKNMYVVPNNIVGQWESIFLSMYPFAKILCIEPKSFKPEKRQEILAKIRDEDYDGIIIAYSCFEQIPLSKEYYKEMLIEEKKTIASTIMKRNKCTSKLKKKKEEMYKAIKKMYDEPSCMDSGICFDELGITRLFVDEIHNFKNVPVDTKIDKVLGISRTGSKKCKDMIDKVHMVQKKNDGGGVVLATGTPITNSVTDIYVMQKYLQEGELAMLELQSFDSWIGMFAERNTEFEIDVDTSSYRLATRFSKFHNLPELTTMISSIADFHQLDTTDGVPEVNGYNDTLVPKTSEFDEYLKSISKRADRVRNGAIGRKDDNMLMITTDGRKAALDLRLVDKNMAYSVQSKVAYCAKNVAEIYERTAEIKGTQLIFCDVSTPKKDFNMYDEMKDKLVNSGVPENMVAYVHDANTEAARKKLFEKVRKGEIRILIGSTFKLGIGVNVQDRLVAIHHLDVPWRPADMTQREGRILRQGNMNKQVEIYRYITEGSFDAYSWQLLETKQRFITDLLAGSLEHRSSSDVDSTVLNYAEIKALAVGSPLIKKRVEAFNELTRYKLLQKKLIERRINMKKTWSELPYYIEKKKKEISACEKDMAYYESLKASKPNAISESDSKANGSMENETKANELKAKESEERKLIREKLHSELMEHILEPREKQLFNYKGFEVILPANMYYEKKYVWLEREGRYRVDLENSKIGNLTRIDNFLEGFDKYMDGLKEGLLRLETKQSELDRELNSGESYVDMIEAYKKEVEDIDKELGVDKNE